MPFLILFISLENSLLFNNFLEDNIGNKLEKSHLSIT